jgi:VanZ family protein
MAWAALIFWGSTDALSAQRTSRFLTPFLRWLVPGIGDESIAMARAVIRKGGHVTEYGVMAVLVAWAARGTRMDDSGRRLFACAWFVAALYAATDEWHQSFQPTRQGQVLDVAIDAAGAAIGAWVFVMVARWKARRRGTVATPALA